MAWSHVVLLSLSRAHISNMLVERLEVTQSFGAEGLTNHLRK